VPPVGVSAVDAALDLEQLIDLDDPTEDLISDWTQDLARGTRDRLLSGALANGRMLRIRPFAVSSVIPRLVT